MFDISTLIFFTSNGLYFILLQPSSCILYLARISLFQVHISFCIFISHGLIGVFPAVKAACSQQSHSYPATMWPLLNPAPQLTTEKEALSSVHNTPNMYFDPSA